MATSAKAAIAAFDNADFSELLAVKLEQLPVVFPLHMIAGAIALVLAPVALALRHRPQWHKPAGGIAAVSVAVAGVTAYPVAWIAPVSTWSAFGFIAQATVWLALLVAGIAFIRRGRVAEHRACMLMMLAVTSGAIFFRIHLAIWAIFAHGRYFELFYACNAWVAWLLPLALAALALQRFGHRRAFSR